MVRRGPRVSDENDPPKVSNAPFSRPPPKWRDLGNMAGLRHNHACNPVGEVQHSLGCCHRSHLPLSDTPPRSALPQLSGM